MPRSLFNLPIFQSPRFRSWRARTRVLRPLKIAGVLYLGYLALLTLVAMPALNLLAPRLYHAETGRELRLDKIILLNPFTLSITVRNAASDNPDHSRFWAFDRLHADIALRSLWRRQLVLDLVQLKGLYVQIDQTAADRYNFSDILDYRAARTASPQATPAGGKAELFPISIERIELDAGHLGLRAPHLGEPLAFEIGDLAIAIDNFSTVAINRSEDVTLEPTAPALDFELIAPLHSSAIAVGAGHLKVDFLRAEHPFAAQLDGLQFNMEGFSGAAQPQDYQLRAAPHAGGALQAKGRFDLARREHSGELHIDGFNLLPAWHYLAPQLAFEMQRGQLDAHLPYRLQWGESLRYFVDNGRIALREAQLQSQRDADTQVGVKALNVDGIQVDSAQESAHIAAISVDGLFLHGWNDTAQISLRDMFQFKSKSDAATESNWQVSVDEVTAQHGLLRWRTDLLDVPELVAEPLDIHARDIQWPVAKDAKFTIKTRLNTDTQLAVDGVLNLADRTGKVSGDIAGLPLQWGNRLLGQQINAQLKSGTASAHFDLTLAKGQPTQVRSDGHIDQLELQRLPDQQKLAAWQRLEWKKLALNLPAQKLRIEQIVAIKPWLAFRLNPDGTNNFQTLTAQKKVTPPLPESAKIATQPAPDQKPWLFTIRNIHTENGLLDFRDASLSRSFHATIADFTGDVEGLSNREDALAKIAFKGTVDGYAPVALTGTANPFAATPALDITLDIANLDLSTLTPYSGTYAGYTIKGGRLSVQLAYTLKDGRMQGSNHIVVNQLELGEQVRGPKVMDLPLRFAIYLLTDSNGVMDLGVDVTGSMDDPNFSVASIIWKAFRNVIVKAATSPFRALSRLVKGADEDLDRIAFPAGSDRIVDADTAKLNSLNEALQKKTALRLNISGHVSPGQDIEGLRDNSLSADLIAQSRIAPADIQQQSTGWQDAVAKLYKKRFPADTSGKLSTMQMNDSMRDNVELDPRALDELAGRRALAVKQALVADRGLSAERAAVAPVDLGTDKNPGLHATMTLE
jgi:hypothetical protein